MKILNITILLLLVLGVNDYLNGQVTLSTESETHIFWQPGRMLKSEDFKGNYPTDPKFIKYCEAFNLCTSAYVGLFAVLDIPKKKKDRGILIEKAYFAPAFEKNTSYLLKNDSLGIKKQQVIFDIYELSARFARKELKKLQDSIQAYGIISIMFKSVETKINGLKDALTDSFVKDVYIDNKPEAFEKWRKQIDQALNDSKEFATTPEDCYRFVLMRPINQKYIKAKKIAGDLFEKK